MIRGVAACGIIAIVLIALALSGGGTNAFHERARLLLCFVVNAGTLDPARDPEPNQTFKIGLTHNKLRIKSFGALSSVHPLPTDAAAFQSPALPEPFGLTTLGVDSGDDVDEMDERRGRHPG